jgi:hypothetical protein
MQGMDMPRVVLGGLVAGLVINLFEWLGGLLYMEDMFAALEAHELSFEMTPGMIVVSLLMGFLAGFVAVWFYAACRPRFGPGPKTAARVGLVLFLGGYLLAILGYSFLGIFPTRLLTVWAGVALVEMVLATIAGAWVYREASSAAA